VRALRPARRKYLRARASLHLNMISAISILIRGTLRAFHRSHAPSCERRNHPPLRLPAEPLAFPGRVKPRRVIERACA